MDLYNDNVTDKPQSFDFSEGYTETWDAIMPAFDDAEAEKLFEIADDYGISLSDDPRDLNRAEIVSGLESIGIACYDEESDDLLAAAYGDSMMAGDLDGSADCWLDEIRESLYDSVMPMMNYRYPVNIDRIDSAIEAAEKLCDLPLTLIEETESGDYFLALTGGGMDLSAEICKAYIALGQRPPAHFCGVPRMSGRKYEREFLTILAESCQIATNWQSSTLADLERIAADPDYSAEPGPLAYRFKPE